MKSAMEKAQLLNQKLRNEQPEPERQKAIPHISRAEYEKKYNLSDPEVFNEQGNRLTVVEEVITLQAIMLKLTKHNDPREMYREIQEWHRESVHFRDILRERVIEQEKARAD